VAIERAFGTPDLSFTEVKERNMPMKVRLTQGLVDRANTLKVKENLFDTDISGFLCEVTSSGRKTFHVIFKDEYGRQRQKKFGDAALMSVKDARTKAGEMLLLASTSGAASLYHGRDLRACPTLAEFVRTHYMPHAMKKKRSWSTDESLLRNHLLPAFGKKVLAEISEDDIETYYDDSIAQGAAIGSANRRIILLRYIFSLAIKKWKIPGLKENPARLVKLTNADNYVERFLSAEETARLQQTIEESPNRMLRFIIPALLLTGMRKREVLDARWENINIKARTWFLPAASTKARRARTVHLSEPLVQLLEAVPRRGACPYVFPNPDTGKPFVSIFYSWNTARCKAGLSDVRIHDLRHTFASLLINNNFALYDVMHALGHTQITTTQRYAHLSDERKRAAVDAVAKGSGLLTVLPVASPANLTPIEQSA
jgi:integrase